MDIELRYKPFAKQIEAHSKTEEIVGYFGGWGSGKTTWVLAEAFRTTCFLPGIPGILPEAQNITVTTGFKSIFTIYGSRTRAADRAGRGLRIGKTSEI